MWWGAIWRWLTGWKHSLSLRVSRTGRFGRTGLALESLEPRLVLSGGELTAAEVQTLLDRASAATPSQDAIIAVVDRGGHVLGVRVEDQVTYPDQSTLVYMVDGALAEARTAAFFANDTAPLTSRLIGYISQTTITQREVEANPSITDPNSTLAGPGFVAPIGVGGHFPPGIANTPPVDLFDIEGTNRDNDPTGQRFNANYIPGQQLDSPVSYGVASGTDPTALARGIGTLPGGIPIMRDQPDGTKLLVGGIGVFFPGPNGYATFEQNFIPNHHQTYSQRTNAPLEREAEYIALAAVGGIAVPGGQIGTIDGIAPVSGLVLPFGNISLAGINLPILGPTAGIVGVRNIIAYGHQLNLHGGGVVNGTALPVTPTNLDYIDGTALPDGWLVAPHASTVDNISAADVQQMINQAIAAANETRAQIRLPVGARARMVFAVADSQGNVLGLYRMPDATYFSVAVAVAKARNTAYYASSNLQPEDQVPGIAQGVAFTNRTFRFLAEPRFPAGIEGTEPPPFSILNDPGVNPKTAENVGAPVPASAFTSVLGYDSFHPNTNFHDPINPQNQNGVVFFPGSTPIYKGSQLIGGLGVSGDGVNQDDFVTYLATQGFQPKPPLVVRADQVFFRNTRLPYFDFPRNPTA